MQKKKYIIVQNPDINTNNNKLLMLVDRRKSKKYWWTYDISITLITPLKDAEKILSNLKYGKCKIIKLEDYEKNN